MARQGQNRTPKGPGGLLEPQDEHKRPNEGQRMRRGKQQMDPRVGQEVPKGTPRSGKEGVDESKRKFKRGKIILK